MRREFDACCSAPVCVPGELINFGGLYTPEKRCVKRALYLPLLKSGFLYLMQRLRVSAISFLNTAPLMWDFDYGPLRREYRVDYTLPAQCAELLRMDEADIGIIPVAAYATIPDLAIIPDVAIAARGPVRSIFLISKVSAEKINSVATDTSSRTS